MTYPFVPVFYFSDSDCGGGTCDFDNPTNQGNCECKCEGCLVRTDTIGTGSSSSNDVGCTLGCICGDACSSTNFNEEGATCDGTGDSCQDCSTNTECPADTDCIIDSGQSQGKCVDSGLCTAKKKDLCDVAYAAVSGGTNQRAKCCPATSGCIRTQIGVKATSSCSTNCGSCLGDDKLGGDIKHPITFCKFGQRLGEISNIDFANVDCFFLLSETTHY